MTILRLVIAESRRVLRGHDHYWKVIRQLTADGQGCTTSAIADQCEPGVGKAVNDYVKRLIRAGIAYRDEDGLVYLKDRPRDTPRLLRDGSESQLWRGRQQMWNVMRRDVGGFTLKSLSIDATTDTASVSEDAAQRYCRILLEAGVLVVANPDRQPGSRHKIVYRLTGSGNTGPKAPIAVEARGIYDPNLERLVGEPVTEEIAL
jgi:hypothetical protein